MQEIQSVQERAARQIIAFSDRNSALTAELEGAQSETHAVADEAEKRKGELTKLKDEIDRLQMQVVEANEQAREASASEAKARRELAMIRDNAVHDAQRSSEERTVRAQQVRSLCRAGCSSARPHPLPDLFPSHFPPICQLAKAIDEARAAKQALEQSRSERDSAVDEAKRLKR